VSHTVHVCCVCLFMLCVCRWVKPDEGGFKRPPRSPDSGLARQAMSAGDQTNSLRSARDDSGRCDDSSSAPGVPLAGVASLEAASSFLSVASERSCESDDNQSPRKGSAMVSVDSADESGGATERATGHSDDNDDDDALSSSDDDLYYGDSDSEDESFNPDDWNDSVHMMHDDGEGCVFPFVSSAAQYSILCFLVNRHGYSEIFDWRRTVRITSWRQAPETTGGIARTPSQFIFLRKIAMKKQYFLI